MKKIATTQLLATLGMGALLSCPAAAIEGDNWWLGGRIKQGYSIARDLEHQGSEPGPANFLIEVNGNWAPSNNLTFSASFWLRGDHFTDSGDDLIQGGIQDFTSPGFVDKFGFNINGAGTGFPTQPFGATADGNKYLSHFNDEVIRDLSVKYRDPKGRFAIKAGKFQRGWGQSDGLRLLDVLHAQDLRERFVLRDAQDIRIPAWMVALDLDFKRMGLAKAFEAIGMKRPALELLYIPEVHHSQLVINNPTPSSASSGGLFGFPFPHLIDSQSQLGLAFIGVNLEDNEAKKFSTSDAEVAARLRFEALGADWSLNAFYGKQDLPVVRLTGSQLVIGSALSDPSQALAAVPLDVATTVGAAHGPGGYLDFLRSLTTAPGSVPFPLAPFGCTDPLSGGFPDCSLNLNFDLDYDLDQKVVGFSMTRELRELKLGPKNVSPVLRLEASYEFDKPFNSSQVMTPFGEIENGTTALVIDPSQSVVERDQWGVMVGVDYFLWLPFWKDQRSSIFTSFQLFNIHTDDHENLLYQAPYSARDSLVNETQTYASLLWDVGLFQEKLKIEGLSLWDADNHGFVHRQRIDLNFWGDKIRPRLEWIHFNGSHEQGVVGLFRHSDIYEFSLTIQF